MSARRYGSILMVLGFSGCARISAAAEADATTPTVIEAPTMQRIYDEVKTPFKYGVVLRGDTTNQLVDCPSIFRSGKQWFMMYVAITDAVGYETYLAAATIC